MAARRGRKFDVDEALDVAIALFGRQGYEGTSVAELTAAMGINPPSLYAAFGSKRELFEVAVDRYMVARDAGLVAALAEPTAWEASRRMLVNFVDDVTAEGQPAGCLTVGSGLTCSDENRDVSESLSRRRRFAQERLRARFQAAVDCGELPATADPESLSCYVATVAMGVADQATGGSTREELLAAVCVAMDALPKGRQRTRRPRLAAVSV